MTSKPRQKRSDRRPSGVRSAGIGPRPGGCASHAAGVRKLSAHLREVLAELPAARTALRDHLSAAADLLDRTDVTIAFAGHFKSGKSTLLNAILGRNVLPVNDLPETGVICELRTGDGDGATAVLERGRRRIPCTTEGVRKQIGLISKSGERRRVVQTRRRIEIRYSGTIIPHGVCWLDSPGYNDTPEMDERSREAASEADLLVWVLASRQFLSEVEMDFLNSYVNESGPEAVVFILNAFLGSDAVPEWTTFCSKVLPELAKKLNGHSSHMGFRGKATPLLFPVAARAALDTPNDFGMPEVRQFLSAVRGPTHSRILRRRLHQVSLKLSLATSEVDRQIDCERARIERTKAERNSNLKDAATKETRFREAVAKTVDAFLNRLSERARGGAKAMTQTLKAKTVASSDVHEAKLRHLLQSCIQSDVGQLIKDITTLSRKLKYHSVGSATERCLLSKLRIGRIRVTIPPRPDHGGKVLGGAAAGAAIGSVVPGVGTVLGALVGGALGLVRLSNAETQDSEFQLIGLRSSILQATESTVLKLTKKKKEVVTLLLAACIPVHANAEVPCTDELERLQLIHDKLIRLEKRTCRLAEPRV